jgi:hypothetical protein
MKYSTFIQLLLFIAIVGISRGVVAQEAPVVSDNIPSGVGTPPVRHKDSYLRLFGGIGVNIGLRNDVPAATSIFLSRQNLHGVLTAGFISGSKPSRELPNKSWFELNAAYGYAMNGNDLGYFERDADQIYVAISGGLGIFSYQENWPFRRRFFNPIDTLSSHQNLSVVGIGVPIMVQANYAMFKYVGFGVSLFANLNTYLINYGTLISLELISPW